MASDVGSGGPQTAPDFNRMPDEMKAHPNWVMFKLEERDGRKTKVPYSVAGERASVNDASTWATFDAARAAFKAGVYDGIGFVFGPNDPFAGIDLDDSEGDDAIKARQDAIYDAFGSYSELSPSGRGLHIIVKGSVPQGRRRDCVEIYSNERFFTMTGNVYRDAPIAEHHALLNALWHDMRGSVVAFDAKPYFRAKTEADEAIYERAAKAANGAKFLALWNGDPSAVDGYDKSGSAIDQALGGVDKFVAVHCGQCSLVP